MYVCLCTPVTEKEIHAAVSRGASNLDHVRKELGCCNGCGRCIRNALDTIECAKARASGPAERHNPTTQPKWRPIHERRQEGHPAA